MPLFSRKKYTTIKVRKKDLPGGLWSKCPECGEIVYKQEIESNLGVCPKCAFHFQISWKERLALLTEPGSFEEWDANLVSTDPLAFTGQSAYAAKLADSRKKTKLKEAVVCGQARIGPHTVALGIHEFSFIAGSMASVVGEKVTRLIERATAAKLPVVIVIASGGARMHEGMLSLMQMAKTSAALARHDRAGLPYITILTHPSTAGVMASYGALGDVIIAEPKAMICFAGARVIRETTREEIPLGFQRSEFVFRHGLVDMIVPRKELKQTVIHVLNYINRSAPAPVPAAPSA